MRKLLKMLGRCTVLSRKKTIYLDFLCAGLLDHPECSALGRLAGAPAVRLWQTDLA
jgi:hypothetical protein